MNPDSAQVDGPPVPVHPDLAIAPAVMEAAEDGSFLLMDGGHIRCAMCMQSVMYAGGYFVSIANLRATLLAHLMQRHGWTREVPGDR